MLPNIGLRVGSFTIIMQKPDLVRDANLGSGYFGNFGLDLLRQAREATVDFRSMRLTLR